MAADAIVASVQSLGGPNASRLRKYNDEAFKCIIVDEVQHSERGNTPFSHKSVQDQALKEAYIHSRP